MKFLNKTLQALMPAPRRRRTGWLGVCAVLFAATVGLPGCGGGGDEGTAASGDSGELVVSLTDAPGDFTTYTVDVVSVSLTRANGVVVETLPLATRVDFSQYTELSEFLTAATVPSGVYVQGSLTLDYSNADIQVQDADGNAVKVDDIQDANGDPVTTLELSVRLEGRNQLPIVPGVPKHLTLDFDLESSNTVSFDEAGAPTVVVEPVLIAAVDPEKPKIHRVRGPLNVVAEDRSGFSVYIRPFRHHVHRLGVDFRHFGALRVSTDDETVYEIDGVVYSGAEGLAALAAKVKFTAVIAVGDLEFNPRRFRAREVYAGSSVPGGDLDVVTGNVVARSGDALTVRGATLARADGVVVFNDNVTINLADSTTVGRQLSMELHQIDDISVGQRLTVFGSITNDQISDLVLDASAGYARMLLTTLRAQRTVVAEEPWFTVSLESIDGRPVSMFDFADTGTDAANDALAGAYEIDTGALAVDAIADQSPLAVRGFVTPFGTAPADFTVQTIVDRSAVVQ